MTLKRAIGMAIIALASSAAMALGAHAATHAGHAAATYHLELNR